MLSLIYQLMVSIGLIYLILLVLLLYFHPFASAMGKVFSSTSAPAFAWKRTPDSNTVTPDYLEFQLWDTIQVRQIPQRRLVGLRSALGFSGA